MNSISRSPHRRRRQINLIRLQRPSHKVSLLSVIEDLKSQLIASGCNISYVDIGGDETKAKKKAESKTKYVCPECGLNAWAKPEAKLTCTGMRDCKGGLVFPFYQRYRGYLLPVNSNIRHRIACKFSVERFHTSACDYNRADAPV